MTRPRATLVGVLALAPLLACATAAPQRERSVLAGSAARSLLILPLNLIAAMPRELEALSPVVWEELESYLRERDVQLKTVNRRDARRLWLASVREVRAASERAVAGHDETARVLVAKLAQHADFDTVVAPSLFVRKAPVYGRVASWDGVDRPLETEARGAAAQMKLIETQLEGVAPAASFHAVVLDARGNELQEAIGGIELLVRVEALPRSSGALSMRYVTRTDLFANRAWVRQGIATALAPFIPLEPE